MFLLFLTAATFLGIALFRPRVLLWIVIFLAPWTGIFADVGITLTAYQIAIAALGIALCVRATLGGRGLAWNALGISGLAFLTYAVVRSLVQIPILPEAEVVGGVLRGPVPRAIFQIVRLIVNIAPVLLVPALMRDGRDLRRAGRIFVGSCVVLSALGWAQIAVWYTTGHNPLPIGLIPNMLGLVVSPTYGIGEGIIFYPGGVTLYRMNSLGGEPKDLGAHLAIGLILIQAYGVRGGLGRRLYFAWGFIFVSLLMTLSSQGLALWLLGTALEALFFMFGRFRWRITSVAKAFVATSVTLVIALVIIVPVLYRLAGVEVSDLLLVAEERTVGRDPVEDFDAAVLEFLLDKPQFAVFGVGLGNAHLYANDYLPFYAQYYAKKTAFTAKTGVLKLISELGLVGLALFFWWIASRMRALKTAAIFGGSWLNSTDKSAADMLLFVMPVLFVLYLARGNYVVNEWFLALGVACAACTSIGRSARKMKGAW